MSDLKMFILKNNNMVIDGNDFSKLCFIVMSRQENYMYKHFLT